MVGLDWSRTKGNVMVVGECHFVGFAMFRHV